MDFGKGRRRRIDGAQLRNEGARAAPVALEEHFSYSGGASEITVDLKHKPVRAERVMIEQVRKCEP